MTSFARLEELGTRAADRFSSMDTEAWADLDSPNSRAHQHQSSEGVPIRVICEQDTAFYRVVHDIFSRAFPFNPRMVKQKIDAGAGLKLGGLCAEVKKSVERGDAPEPKSINEAVQITEFLLELHSREPVIIIDEFVKVRQGGEMPKARKHERPRHPAQLPGQSV
jgi:hypothetical protein